MDIKVLTGSCLDFQGEVIILFHFSDVRPLTGNPALLDWRCNASVSILLKRKLDLFKFGQITVMAPQGKIHFEKVILTGLGASDALDRDMRREACRVALEAALKVGAREVAIDGSVLMGGRQRITVDDVRGVLGKMAKKGSTLRVTLFSGEDRQRSPSGEKEEPADGAV